jgi:hypothetical protein
VKMRQLVLPCLILLAMARWTSAAEWTWQWNAVEDRAPTAEVTKFRYGKVFAYALEMDDGPKSMRTVAMPLLAKQAYTDAPPGVAGGNRRPFVGGAAIIVGSTGTRNSSVIHWDGLQKLRDAGWSLLNHSYFHAGRSYGNPPEILSDDQMRFDLFWAQTIIAARTAEGPPTHFVYPNGYMDYAKVLGEFGILSGSRVSGSSGRDAYGPKLKMLDVSRNYLDEGYWKNNFKGEVMAGFPMPDGPKEGEVVLDFTHGMSDDANSENAQRWKQRIETIGRTFGADGADTIWCAPSDEIYVYVNAAKAADVEAGRGSLKVTIPDHVPGTRLTVKLTGVDEKSEITPPEGGVVYRQGTTVWVTSPMIGTPGARMPGPKVKMVHQGPVEDLKFDQPVKLAAVRLLQGGPVADGFQLRITAIGPGGEAVEIVPEDKQTLSRAWGKWQLYGPVPLADAIAVQELKLTRDRNLQEMEIWAVDE